MPLYEYQCRKCGKRHEKIENLNGPHLKKCPSCGGPVERLMSAPAIQFKGSGWYVTDYGKSGSTPAKSDKPEGSSEKSGSGDSGKGEKGEAKTEKPAEKKSKDKKSAAKEK